MKLRSLQIKGFKSFGNETTIHFNDEIIGIVGPNGSGKSNIVDAIRWVLGEQKSKELRLDKMVDVIFNGTKSKRRAGMAMVSMTFENSKKLIPVEFDTVKVSRVLYDTNESEYRINDVPCRLRDVRDLFIDTGIGSNSYAIIELGMVDDIITDKDHSRRKMFEQAAGISKYKIRKRETQLKLKNTQLDLDRVEDILFELQSSMKALERQAKRTKRYYELKEEYKDLSIKRALISQSTAIEQERTLKEKMSLENDKLVNLTSQANSLDAEIEKIKKENLDSEQALSSKQKEFNDIVDQVRQGENRKEIKKQNIQFLGQNIKRTESNLSDHSQSYDEISKILDKKLSEYEALENDGADVESKYQTLKSAFQQVDQERQSMVGSGNEKMTLLKNLEDKKFGLEKSIIEINSRIANNLQNKNVAQEQIDHQQSGIDALQKDNLETSSSIEDLRSKLSALRDEKVNLNNLQEDLESKLNEQRENLSGLNRKLDALTNEHDLLNDMVNNLEGFPESAKFLINQWSESKPILSDIIECPDEYRGAIEAYLENYLGYFILDNINEARSSIDLLKKAQKGRSQFFILSSFEDKISRTQLLYDQHGLPALEVVKVDRKYDGLIHHLLQNVVLVEDDEVLAADTLDQDITYLSKNGSTNRTKHMITGGSIGLFDGKRIGRKKEIEKLAEKIQSTKEEIGTASHKKSSIESQIAELSEKDQEAMINDCIEKLNVLEVKKAERQAQISSAEEIIDSLKQQISGFEQDDKSGGENIDQLQSELDKLNAELDKQKEQVDSQTGHIESISQKFAEINASFNEAQLVHVKHQNDLQNLNNEITFRRQQIEELESKKNHSVAELERYKLELEQNKTELESIEKKLIQDYTFKKEKQEELSVTEQAFFSKRSVVHEKEDELKKINKAVQNLQLEINDLKDKLTGIEFELRSAMERLKIEFNIDPKTLNKDEYEVPEEEIEALMEKYEKIKRRLDNYGEINPLAVEAYDEILERHDSMVAQRDDIVEARTSLEETIKEIDTDATEKFLESFSKVKENFKEVFRSLFSSEDDCDLVLFNSENPLESDIEIVAKPKGKRPKVLNQLSGGEKTLTATALLFSLYLLKPAPFCIFDEVDAPLDDVNIQKFSKLIRQFSDASQFIIITHNKSTMASMDLLYGVYMQEQGVSGVTKVDFREYEHDEIFKNVNV